ncbi:MAG: dihydrofolate reductase family protein [Gammaproteobacteria bacterium]
MRKLITAAFVSVDGVMQAPGRPEEDSSGGFKFGGWVAPGVDDVFGREVDALFAAPFDLLLGRKTYEIFAAYWPYHQGEYDPIAKRFNAVTKYVATRSETPLIWKRSVALHDAAADVARLKNEDGPSLLTQGSSHLLQTLLMHDLIDELRMFIFPLVLGRGKRLFGEGTKPAALELVDSKVTTAGVTISSYRPAGPVKTSDLATNPPSEAELKRRERMKREG